MTELKKWEINKYKYNKEHRKEYYYIPVSFGRKDKLDDCPEYQKLLEICKIHNCTMGEGIRIAIMGVKIGE